jgi:cyclopropane fatty-acyl-phospholipid synthase-like methyltransferase
VSIKTMKLYDRVERIENELRELHLDESQPLEACTLAPFDQYHYLGTQAVDHAATTLRIGRQSRVLDVGSGIGGPARHLASTTGCEVVALELQDDLHRTGVELTRRCRLEGRVRHICGDILEPPQSIGEFDRIISLLCFLHVENRGRLFQICHDLLRHDGEMLIEDFVLRRQPSRHEEEALRIGVACRALPFAKAYADELERAGFAVRQSTEMTAVWSEFTAERLKAFRLARERNLRVHGSDVTDGLDAFYATVAELFANGVIGGVRIHAGATP